MSAADDDTGLRKPPFSSEAEQAVLGALLQDASTFDSVADLVNARSFFVMEHRVVFAAVARMVEAGQAVDVITVAEVCRGQLEFEDVAPMAWLFGLTQSVTSPAMARHYAEIVRERALQRALIVSADAVAVRAYRGEVPAAQQIDAAMAELTRLGGGMAKHETQSLDTALVAFIDRLSDEAEGKTRTIQTGLADLDRQLSGGLREGELMVIGARPKMGKTALVLTMARNMARRYGVLMCSQEMPVSQLIARNVAAMGEVQLQQLRNPSELQPDGWTRVTEAIERMKGMHMMLDEQRALTLADIRRKVMDAKRRQAVDVVIVDFLQLMAGEGDNRNQELDRISNGLKAMAGEFGCAVVLLSQLSREADKRHGPPVMTDLRDSGAIEAAADVIALLYREFAHPLGQHTDDWREHAQLEIVQRNGAPGSVNLRWNGAYQQFSDWAGHTPFRKAAGRSFKGGGLD